MHGTKILTETDRLMTVCNSCRYCEGLCAVFPAMEMRRAFSDGDLNYLANLCHGCGACFIDCQFSPPHAFNVNVPKVLEEVRAQSYAAYAWPAFSAGLFAHNLPALSLGAALSVALFMIGFVAWQQPGAVFGRHAGDFYALMPHHAMAGLFGAPFMYALVALGPASDGSDVLAGAAGCRAASSSRWRRRRLLQQGGHGRPPPVISSSYV